MKETAKTQECSPNGCYCDNPESCEGIVVHRKLVYCEDYRCLWNVPVSPGRFVKHHQNWKPIGDAGKYRGICGRPELGLMKENDIEHLGKKIKVTRCHYRSSKKIGGHMDFSKLVNSDGNPYGGNIPDPVSPHAAF